MEESKGQQAVVRRSTRVRTLTYKAQAIEDEKQRTKKIAELSQVRKKKIELYKKARAELDTMFNKENDQAIAKVS